MEEFEKKALATSMLKPGSQSINIQRIILNERQ